MRNALAIALVVFSLSMTVPRPAAAFIEGGFDMNMNLDFSGLERAAIAAAVVGGVLYATPLVGNSYCLAAGEHSRGWGIAGVTIGSLYLLGGALGLGLMVADHDDAESQAIGLAVAGAGAVLTALSAVTLLRAEASSRVSVTPTVFRGRQSSAPGMALVGRW